MQHRREVIRGAAFLLGGGAALASGAAKAGYAPAPTVYGFNQNTALQVFDPGSGSLNRTAAENLVFMSGEGPVWGPGNRPDATNIWNEPLNLFKRHKHTRFDQIQFSSTRPTDDLAWTATGAGSFSISAGVNGGILNMNTGSSAAGDGGTVLQDFNTFQLNSGTKVYFFLNPVTSSSNQVILMGAKANSTNLIFFERSDIGSESAWLCITEAGGVQTSFAPGVTTGLNRTIFCISSPDGGTLYWWIGNNINTIIQRATTTLNVPTGQTLSPFISFNSQGAAVNRVLQTTDIYVINNA